MIKRLFDIVAQRCEQTPDDVMLAAKAASSWKTYSSREVWETANALSSGLLALGIKNDVLEPEQQEKIAIISTNRPEWVITDLAAQLCGAVLTPIYPTISVQELAFILQEAEVEKIFVSGQEMISRFEAAFSQISTLKHIISFDPNTTATHWKTLLKQDTSEVSALKERISASTLATIIYTSGTTGTPKGVMLTHHNIVSNVRDSLPIFSFAHVGEKALSFLPLNHIFERMVTYIYLSAGVSIYYAQSMETIGDNLKEVKPFVFTTVPRLLEKVYEKIIAKGFELKGVKRALFFWALDLAKVYDNQHSGNLWYRLQLAAANKIIFSKWREALGGNVRAIVTGSAACQIRLLRIFTAAGIVIMEGYGLTETSPVISVNRYESSGRRIGTIGPVIDNVEVKIAEDGEILTRGENVMLGYYKRPELTAEAMAGGWFHTGDIGEWVDEIFLKITDRKKEIFKTSGGKYVAPQPIENKMKESLYIEQIMVVGAERKFTGALIVPAFNHVRNYLAQKNIPVPEKNEDLIRLPEVLQLIRKQLDKYNPSFNRVEQVKKFVLLPEEWTIDSGELTPSLKIRRKAIEKVFQREINSLYV